MPSSWPGALATANPGCGLKARADTCSLLPEACSLACCPPQPHQGPSPRGTLTQGVLPSPAVKGGLPCPAGGRAAQDPSSHHPTLRAVSCLRSAEGHGLGRSHRWWAATALQTEGAGRRPTESGSTEALRVRADAGAGWEPGARPTWRCLSACSTRLWSSQGGPWAAQATLAAPSVLSQLGHSHLLRPAVTWPLQGAGTPGGTKEGVRVGARGGGLGRPCSRGQYALLTSSLP